MGVVTLGELTSASAATDLSEALLSINTSPPLIATARAAARPVPVVQPVITNTCPESSRSISAWAMCSTHTAEVWEAASCWRARGLESRLGKPPWQSQGVSKIGY